MRHARGSPPVLLESRRGCGHSGLVGDDRRYRALGAPRRVLLVEDDAAARRALHMLLEEAGFTVQDSASGEQALAALGTTVPDALVVDLQLPGIDGVTLAGAARARRAGLPVVVMSGFDRTHPRLAAFLCAPHTEHVGKPIDVRILVDTLIRLVAPDAADAG